MDESYSGRPGLTPNRAGKTPRDYLALAAQKLGLGARGGQAQAQGAGRPYERLGREDAGGGQPSESREDMALAAPARDRPQADIAARAADGLPAEADAMAQAGRSGAVSRDALADRVQAGRSVLTDAMAQADKAAQVGPMGTAGGAPWEDSAQVGAMVQATGQGPAQVLSKKDIARAIATLKKYKEGKRNLESRIVEEERWWRLRHWDVIRGKGSYQMQGEEKRPEPTSAWLFNSIANKHADIMDNYPEPNVLPREQQDEKGADTLSAILPVVFDRNEYEKTYSQSAWYKLKHGVVAKGVFWNKDLEDGMGDVDVRFIDMLNIFWEPGITDLQASRNLFVVDLQDSDLLQQQYPQLRGKTGGQIIDVKQYVYDDTVDVTDKTVVVDWYYKKRTPEGKILLHYCKFAAGEILYASENEDEYRDRGFYDHGRYPVLFDVLFPEEGTPVGFGYIAIMKSPQLYIDKMSQVILENSMMSAKVRYMVKKSAGINKEQFLDWSDPLVEYEGDIANIQPLQVQQVGGNVLNVLQMKIDELKETSSNRDVSQGSSSGGVTAAAAIAALQEAGNKTSRDMIAASYRSYTQECYLAIELIRQFYDEHRMFRITGPTGENQYIQFSNDSIRPQPLPPAYAGQELEPGYMEASRKPVFDIVVRPQKRSPYSKMAQNELAKELYQMGFFNPQLAQQTMAALELMDFDGLQKVKDTVQQGQTLQNQMAQMQQQMAKMAALIQTVAGQDAMGGQNGAGRGGEEADRQAKLRDAPRLPEGGRQNMGHGGQGRPSVAGKSMGQAQKRAQTSTMTAYGERLAKNAMPSMND